MGMQKGKVKMGNSKAWVVLGLVICIIAHPATGMAGGAFISQPTSVHIQAVHIQAIDYTEDYTEFRPLKETGQPSGYALRFLIGDRLGVTYQQTVIPVEIDNEKTNDPSVLDIRSIGFFGFDRISNSGWGGGMDFYLGSPTLECNSSICEDWKPQSVGTYSWAGRFGYDVAGFGIFGYMQAHYLSINMGSYQSLGTQTINATETGIGIRMVF